jgi:predicted small integral membrane protein
MAATAATAAFFAAFFFLATAMCFTSSNSPGVGRPDDL